MFSIKAILFIVVLVGLFLALSLTGFNQYEDENESN